MKLIELKKLSGQRIWPAVVKSRLVGPFQPQFIFYNQFFAAKPIRPGQASGQHSVGGLRGGGQNITIRGGGGK